MNRKNRKEQNELTIDFGPFFRPQKPPKEGLFQTVKSEMLKRKERMANRRKPIEYEKLQDTIQDNLKYKNFNKEQQRVQVVMLQKCKNYFQVREPKRYTTPKVSRHQAPKRPQTSTTHMRTSVGAASASFIEQLQGVMKDCRDQKAKVKQNMGLFTFYCKIMDRRLVGIRKTIEKKERFI